MYRLMLGMVCEVDESRKFLVFWKQRKQSCHQRFLPVRETTGSCLNKGRETLRHWSSDLSYAKNRNAYEWLSAIMANMAASRAAPSLDSWTSMGKLFLW
jgi:hypothetical protein